MTAAVNVPSTKNTLSWILPSGSGLHTEAAARDLTNPKYFIHVWSATNRLCVTAAPAPSCTSVPIALVNGDFSANNVDVSPTPTGWTVTQASSGTDYTFGPGEGFGFAAENNIDDVVSQVVALVPGCTYQLRYSYESSGQGNNDFNPTVNGSPLLDASGTSLSLLDPAAGIVPYVGVFIATSVETTISFGGYDGADTSYLTSVVLSAA